MSTDEPMRVRIESGPKPFDISVKADDGRELEATRVRWEVSVEDPMPRAHIELDTVAVSFDVLPSVTLVGMDDAKFPLPAGLTTAQVLELRERVGRLSMEAWHLARQRARLIRELHARGVDTDDMLAEPESDLPAQVASRQ